MPTAPPTPEAIERPATQFYTWKGYRCAYSVHQTPEETSGTPILTIHPIGVGLSRLFWKRFCIEWYRQGNRKPVFNPDLLGCGDSEMPRIAYRPEDWAQQLQYFIETVVGEPVILVVQGALFPVAIRLVESASDWVRGLVLSGPPAWGLMTQPGKPLPQKLRWNLFFDTPLGNGFYRYARREGFLESFSKKQLFAKDEDVDAAWLGMLCEGAQNPASRYAVFAFLAGFWRQDYGEAISQMQQPVLALFGDAASGISRKGKRDSGDKRLKDYLDNLPNGQGKVIPGRNVLPYESTVRFVEETVAFVNHCL
ncbi:alpha/beta fold hydrolase [Baaleninema sp.]|uniref:alpha/beta fold hydrolase n=1 Tax=Baaleninema sp. TaxID=3101197 RepID=UPI003D057B5A